MKNLDESLGAPFYGLDIPANLPFLLPASTFIEAYIPAFFSYTD
jgi:hypothetical protein